MIKYINKSLLQVKNGQIWHSKPAYKSQQDLRTSRTSESPQQNKDQSISINIDGYQMLSIWMIKIKHCVKAIFRKAESTLKMRRWNRIIMSLHWLNIKIPYVRVYWSNSEKSCENINDILAEKS